MPSVLGFLGLRPGTIQDRPCEIYQNSSSIGFCMDPKPGDQALVMCTRLSTTGEFPHTMNTQITHTAEVHFCRFIICMRHRGMDQVYTGCCLFRPCIKRMLCPNCAHVFSVSSQGVIQQSPQFAVRDATMWSSLTLVQTVCHRDGFSRFQAT